MKNLVFLNRVFDDKQELYIEGYKNAARIIRKTINNHHGDKQKLVYPLCFLYRQYLELRLKYLIYSCNKFLNIPIEFKSLTSTHNLRSLIIKLDEPLKKFSFGLEKKFIDENFNLIRNFNKITPSSFEFRYPTDPKGTKNLLQVKSIDLNDLNEKMDKIIEFLDTLSSKLPNYEENEKDQNSSS